MACTYKNDGPSSTCEICGTAKPDDEDASSGTISSSSSSDATVSSSDGMYNICMYVFMIVCINYV